MYHKVKEQAMEIADDERECKGRFKAARMAGEWLVGVRPWGRA